jgi:hypothetical protein
MPDAVISVDSILSAIVSPVDEHVLQIREITLGTKKPAGEAGISVNKTGYMNLPPSFNHFRNPFLNVLRNGRALRYPLD